MNPLLSPATIPKPQTPFALMRALPSCFGIIPPRFMPPLEPYELRNLAQTIEVQILCIVR